MTRSRTTGKARIGVTVIVSVRSKTDIRVMHISRGRPLISALHEPHLPALQFQRTARSGAWVAWRRWMMSSTTSPSLHLDREVLQVPAVRVAPPHPEVRLVDAGLLLFLRHAHRLSSSSVRYFTSSSFSNSSSRSRRIGGVSRR